ncbi:MAG: hypothetical protein QXH21_08800 [Ignisphaera sp.]
MNLTVKIRGKPETISTVLKKMNTNSTCYVYVIVGSEEELLKLVSLSIESGALLEIIPEENIHYCRDMMDYSQKVVEQLNNTQRSNDVSLLNKYKKKVEQRVVQTQQNGQKVSPRFQSEVKETVKLDTEVANPPPQPQSPPKPSALHQTLQNSRGDSGPATEKIVKHEAEDIIAKAEEEASQTEDIHFEELVKMKEEAFSRKIIE